MNKAQKELIQVEKEVKLKKRAISQVDHMQGKFISSLFLSEKKDQGQSPMINLKNVNFFVP